jgi:methionyl aminopeptidase
MWDDGWTVVTRDLQRSAQFEHTVLVTESGHELLTVPADGVPAEVRFAGERLGAGADPVAGLAAD